MSSCFFLEIGNFFPSKKLSQIICEVHRNHFTRSNIVFSKVREVDEIPTITRGSGGAPSKNRNFFEGERGMLTLSGKRPALPGQPEDDLHKACTKHEVSTLRADHAGEKRFQKDGVHDTLDSFEKPLRAALHQLVT